MGVAWLAARSVYAIGYTKKDGTKGEGRMLGNVFYLAELGLLISAGVSAFQLGTSS